MSDERVGTGEARVEIYLAGISEGDLEELVTRLSDFMVEELGKPDGNKDLVKSVIATFPEGWQERPAEEFIADLMERGASSFMLPGASLDDGESGS